MELDYNFKINKKLLKDKLNKFKKTDTKKQGLKEVTHRYTNKSNQFVQEYKSSNFIQYAHLYFLRLNEQKPSLMKQAAEKWTNVKVCKNILDIKGNVIIYNIRKSKL